MKYDSINNTVGTPSLPDPPSPGQEITPTPEAVMAARETLPGVMPYLGEQALEASRRQMDACDKK